MSREHRDLLETLDKHRGFLRQTLDGITDEQARTASTVSDLSLAGHADIIREAIDGTKSMG